MFQELNMIWESTNISRFTYKIHTVWKPCTLNRNMISKKANCLYHQYSLNRAPTQKYLAKINRATSPLCRMGCTCEEDVCHIIFKCLFYHKERLLLINKCCAIKIDFNLKNLFNNKALHLLTEKFLLAVHK